MMVNLISRTALVSVAVAILAMSAQAELEPSLMEQDEVAVRSGIPTEDGPMTFVANEGLLSTDGANYTKIFAQRLFGTTLWSHERRLKYYEHVIRVCAQLASVDAQAVAERRFERITPWLEGTLETAEALTAFRLLNTNYVPAEYPLDKLRNNLSHALRVISPKSEGGVAFRTTNLERVSQALTMIDWGVTLAGYAYGAAVEHALASDAALERIDELRAVLDCAAGKGVEIDEVWYEGLDRAAANLTRDETYYGALMGTLLDHRDEIIVKGLVTTYPLVMTHFHEHLEQYVAGWLTKHTAWGGAKIGAHASHFGAIWTWSLLATYYTIDGLLDQHERAQASVAASTLDYLVHEGYEGEASSAHTEPMVLQAQVTYFDKMEQTSSGFLTGFYDFVSGILGRERHYETALRHFRNLGEALERKLLAAMVTPALPEGIVISGTLINRAGGNPIGGAHVCALSAEVAAILGYSSTGADGRFRMPDLCSGQSALLIGFDPEERTRLAWEKVDIRGFSTDVGRISTRLLPDFSGSLAGGPPEIARILRWMAPETKRMSGVATAHELSERLMSSLGAIRPSQRFLKIFEDSPDAQTVMTCLYGRLNADDARSMWIPGYHVARGEWNIPEGRDTLFARVLMDTVVVMAGAKKYVLLTESNAPGSYCHACRPIIGAFLFGAERDCWQLEAADYYIGEVGDWGEGPEAEVIKIGEDTLGLLLKNSYLAQGIIDETSYLYSLNLGRFVESGVFATGHCGSWPIQKPDESMEIVGWCLRSRLQFVERVGSDFHDLLVATDGDSLDHDLGVAIPVRRTEQFTFIDGKYEKQ